MRRQIMDDKGGPFAGSKPRSATELPSTLKTTRLLLIACAATYLNTVAFGFVYGEGNQTFQLTMVNWLRDRSLYPNDPIRAAFVHYPTLFWHGVAYCSSWLDTRSVLWVAFLLTKFIFFYGLARLLTALLKHPLPVAIIVCGIALAPFLNGFTPFAASDILTQEETQTSLGIALLVWVGCFSLERRWLPAAVTLGITVYINGLFAAFMLVGLMALAVSDYHERKREVLSAATLLVVIGLPSLWVFHSPVSTKFPADYVQTMLWRYPYHFQFLRHTVQELLQGVGILVAAAALVLVTAKFSLTRRYRLELLVCALFVLVLCSAIAGQFFPTPELILFQPLRADSLLFLFSIILIEVYGWNLILEGSAICPATMWVLGCSAILLPLLFEGLLPLLFLFVLVLLALDPKRRFERLCERATQSPALAFVGTFALVAGFVLIRVLGIPWSPIKDGLLITAAILLFVYRVPAVRNNLPQLAAVVCAVALLAALFDAVPHVSTLWNPDRPLASSEIAWRQVQLWAKANSTPDAEFLVPPSWEGFRMLSERPEWVDWKDGEVSFTIPSYATEWKQRLAAEGIDVSGKVPLSKALEAYEREPLEQLEGIARKNEIQYVVQYSRIAYNVAPVFANQDFSVYAVKPAGPMNQPTSETRK